MFTNTDNIIMQNKHIVYDINNDMVVVKWILKYIKK